jgi:hypothetical protein
VDKPEVAVIPITYTHVQMEYYDNSNRYSLYIWYSTSNHDYPASAQEPQHDFNPRCDTIRQKFSYAQSIITYSYIKYPGTSNFILRLLPFLPDPRYSVRFSIKFIGIEGAVFHVSALHRDYRDSITTLSNTAIHRKNANDDILAESCYICLRG